MAKTTHTFQAEIKQLLDLMIHSLYSHKEIFLRELISNASDAIDKLKFEAITNESLKPQNEFSIRIETDPEKRILKIMDNGIGMSAEEVQKYIGTIAHSGTKKFLEMKKQIDQGQATPELIGQFGVGFYSSFMVADKVILHTQKAGTSEGVLWESSGDGSYTFDLIPRAEGVGTTIMLQLKPKEELDQDFTEDWTLKQLVKKYSDFIAYPIQMETETEVEEKKVKKLETLNSQKALWLRAPSTITSEEYKEFYHHVSHDWTEPFQTIHFKAEGTLEFNSLLFIPSQKPWNYGYQDYEHGLQLYVKRVFILSNCKDLLPPYLRFIKGLVDSSDLSLNISREMLQKDRQVSQIRKSLTGKILNSLKETIEKDRPKYETFWKTFGSTLKEGVASDPENKEKLQELLLFSSTKSSDLTTLKEYVERMPADQKDIYFMIGESLSAQSPYLEKLKTKGYEALLLTDPVDEWVMDHMKEYKDKKLQSLLKESLDLSSEEEKKKEDSLKETLKPLIDLFQNLYKDELKEVKISHRLTQSPVCLVSGDYDPSAHMQKILEKLGQGEHKIKRILEINGEHPVFSKMLSAPEEKQKQYAQLLYGQALLTEGSQLPDPAQFAQTMNDFLTNTL